MKLKVKKDELIRIKSMPVSRSAQVPILNCYLLQASDNSLIVTTTDLVTTAILNLNADVIEGGVVAVNGKMLEMIVPQLNAKDEIELAVKGDTLYIRQGRSQFNLYILDAETFPHGKMKSGDGLSFTITRDSLERINRLVSGSVLDNKARPVFTGIYHFAKEGKLTAVSTDGKRITELNQDVPMEGEFLVPPMPMQTILRLSSDSSVNVTINHGTIIYKTNKATVISQLVQGVFPNYQKVMQRDFDTFVTFDRAELLRAIKQVATLSDDIFRVKLEFDGTEVTLSSHNSAVGDGSVKIVPTEHNCNNFVIGLNYKYLQGFLNILESNKVKIYIDGREQTVNTQIFIHNEPEPEGYKLHNLLMPLRLAKDER